MYIAQVSISVNSLASPAMVYSLIKGETIQNIDEKTLLSLLRLNMVKKVADFEPVTETKNDG